MNEWKTNRDCQYEERYSIFWTKVQDLFYTKTIFMKLFVMIISMCFCCNCIFANVKKRQLRSTVPYLEVAIMVVIVL
jgi:hypothetical protein